LVFKPSLARGRFLARPWGGVMEKLIEDLNDILEVLNETKDKSESVFAWYVFNDHTLKVELSIHSIDGSEEEIVLTPDNKSVFLVRELVSGMGTINIYVPKKLLIFSAEFKHVDDEGRLKIGYPTIFKVHDRRGWDRVQLEADILAAFELKGKNWNKKVFDLGSGGMSIVFNKTEHFRGELQERIDRVEITVGEKKVFCQCTIVNILQLKPYLLESCPYGGTRVSFKFDNLDKDSKEILDKVLLSHIGLLNDLG